MMFEQKRQMQYVDFKIYKKSRRISTTICLRCSVQKRGESESMEKSNTVLLKELQYARGNI